MNREHTLSSTEVSGEHENRCSQFISLGQKKFWRVLTLKLRSNKTYHLNLKSQRFYVEVHRALVLTSMYLIFANL